MNCNADQADTASKARSFVQPAKGHSAGKGGLIICMYREWCFLELNAQWFTVYASG